MATSLYGSLTRLQAITGLTQLSFAPLLRPVLVCAWLWLALLRFHELILASDSQAGVPRGA